MKFKASTASIVAALLAIPSQVLADPPMLPVVVYSVGPQRIRVRVATGHVMPCSSSSNQLLFEGPLEPGQSVLVQTPETPICVEHTFGAFPDTDWSRSTWWPPCGRKGGCAPPPVIRVVVSSNRS